MNVKLKQALVLLGASAMVVSCVDEVNLNAPTAGKSDEVYFTASIAKQDFFGTNKAQTRSAAAEKQRVQAGFYDLAIDGRSDIHLSVSTLDGMFGKPAPIPEEGKDNSATRGSMLTKLEQKPMCIVEYGKTADGETIIGSPFTAYTQEGSTWSGNHIQRNSNTVSRTLHAIYPRSESYTIDAATGTVAYNTPESSVDQSDLLYAVAWQELATEQKETVHLIFDHLLTAVRFKIGSQQLPMSVIKLIKIEGIQTSATFNFSTKSWNLNNTMGSVKCYLNFNVTGAENIIINGGESTFMLLPQQLTPNAKVTILYEDYTEGSMMPAEEKTLTASLATASAPAWEPGQCITYTLMGDEAQDDYILEVEAPEDFTSEGGTKEARVISYNKKGGVLTPVRWIVQSYSSDGGRTWMSGGATNPLQGMAISPTEGKGDTTSINVTLFPADTIFAPHGNFLRYKTPLGYSGEAFDLSRHDYLNKPCAQTTANCYVVDAPGKYRIPTAYGNAIVDGMTNKDAYTDIAHYDNCKSGNNFMTHNGKAITAPMIQNNGITLSRATLVWEDVQNLIDPKSIKLVDDGNAIEFEIKPENIGQGNAVIAAMDGNTVAWSWHIWVNDEKATLAKPIIDNNIHNERVEFMPLTLGWCSNAKAKGCLGREAAVRISIPEHPSKRSSFVIHQNSTPAYDTMENANGNATYYNWGRKDPFPGAKGNYVPNGSSDNADNLPKEFFQAGADAAGLGMHAELHAEYGADWKSLFVEGALVGLDGFLTGYTIKQVLVGLKKAGSYPNEFAEIVDDSEVIISHEGKSVSKLNRYSLPAEEGGMGVKILDQQEMAQHVVDVSTDNTLRFPGKFNNGSKTPICNLYGAPYDASQLKVIETKEFGWGILVYDKDVPTDFIEVVVTHAKAGNYSFNVFKVLSSNPVAPYMSLGNFSCIMMTTAHQTLCNEFSLGAAFSNASIFKGGTEWCRQMTAHGVSVEYGIQHPNILLRDPISWINHDGVGNLWNARQTGYDEPDCDVVKTVYDPCPAGYCVPSQRNMSGMTDKTTECNYRGGTERVSVNGIAFQFPGLGFRNFWDAHEPGAAATNNINEQIFFNGDQGMYWTASPAINKNEKGEKGAYAINFRSGESLDYYGNDRGYDYTPRVVNNLKLQQSYALPIRPVREK